METDRILAVLALRGYRVNEDTLLRHVRMEPYLKGKGPAFDLVTWDTGRYHRRGTSLLGYALFSSESEDPIFHGEDASPSPMHAIDSDDATRGILGFLTLRPGVDGYTEAQRAFASAHADSVSLYTLSSYTLDDDPFPWDADLLDH